MLGSYTPDTSTKVAIAAGFLSFGIVALFAPDAIGAIMARDSTLPIVTLAVGTLGAHAMAAGLFALFARFKTWTYAGFAAAMLPIFVMDYWLFAVAGAFNATILLHAGGMTAMLALCVRGFRILQRNEQALEQAI
jgi:hypothetical protein